AALRPRGPDETGPGSPAGEVHPAGADPPVVMLGAQPGAGDPVTAAAHCASSQLVAAPDGLAGVGEVLGHGGTFPVSPSDGVAVAQSLLVRHAVAVGHRALGRAEDRVAGGGDIDRDTELGSDGGHQLLQQPCPPAGRLHGGGGHSRTSRPVNQPASSRVLRASSTVRCPYLSIVVVIEAWLRSSFTDSIPAPLRSSQVA